MPATFTKPKSAIVYLVRGTERCLNSLCHSVQLLAKNFLPANPADIIIFHEADVQGQTLHKLCGDIAVKTVLVDFSSVPPEFSDGSTGLQFGLGYRHMCHFFANDYYLSPILDRYDYVMRMDDDSFILSPIRFNVFERMMQNEIVYTYRAIEQDSPDMCKGLWETVRQFFNSHSELLVGDLPTYPPCLCYYTNFEISNIKWFRGAEWQTFFKTIDQAGGIWRHRWGDAPIRYLGVKSLLPQSRIQCLSELHYFHQSLWTPGHCDKVKYGNFYWKIVKRIPALGSLTRFLH